MYKLNIREDILAAFEQPSVVRLSSTGTLAYQRQREETEVITDTFLSCLPALEALEALRTKSPTHFYHAHRTGPMWKQLLALRSGAIEYLGDTANVGALHDIGKRYIPSSILEGASLTEREMKIMRAHNTFSVIDFMKLQIYFPHIREVLPLHHPHYSREEDHERRGEDRRDLGIELPSEVERRIAERREGEQRKPLHFLVLEAGKLLEIADTYDALSSQRSYKPAWPADTVRQHMLARFPEHNWAIDFLSNNYPNPLGR
ncbi:hypothetical protein J4444_03590 [Candidatus Woesearchaeota archaeon]|nr:hypothetical protein [Candidatus Woesearchaeota archaeon]